MDAALALADRRLVPLMGLEAKRSDAQTCIQGYVTGHVAMDIAIGLTGFVPVPGAGVASMVTAIAAQAPVIYRPMARDLTAIYQRVPGAIEGAEVIRGAIKGGALDLAAAFGVDFFTEIISDLMRELGASFALAWIPILGGVVSTALEAAIAWTMTWRVGLMIALYHENGSEWIESRRHTYALAKKFVQLRRRRDRPPPSIREFIDAVKVGPGQVDSVRALVMMLLKAGLDRDKVRAMLLAQGFSPDIVAAAMV